MGSIFIRTNTQTKEKQELLNIVFVSNRPRRVKARALAVYLNETGVSKKDTATILCMCQKSVDKYVKNYADEGIKSVIQENVYRPKSELENYKEEIKEEIKKDFEERPVQTIDEAVNRIEDFIFLLPFRLHI
jgi:transposase